MLSTKSPVRDKGLTQPVLAWLIFCRSLCFGTHPMFQVLDILSGVPMGLEISQFIRILVLVFTKSLVNMKSLVLMVWSLFTILRDLILKGRLSPPCGES